MRRRLSYKSLMCIYHRYGCFTARSAELIDLLNPDLVTKHFLILRKFWTSYLTPSGPGSESPYPSGWGGSSQETVRVLSLGLSVRVPHPETADERFFVTLDEP